MGEDSKVGNCGLWEMRNDLCSLPFAFALCVLLRSEFGVCTVAGW